MLSRQQLELAADVRLSFEHSECSADVSCVKALPAVPPLQIIDLAGEKPAIASVNCKEHMLHRTPDKVRSEQDCLRCSPS